MIMEESDKASEAGQCAFDQGKFWEFHDLTLSRFPNITVSNLKDYAAEAGLDAARFNDCLNSGQNKQKVEYDLKSAISYGFQTPPAFVIGSTRLVGPVSYEALKKAIDAALANQ